MTGEFLAAEAIVEVPRGSRNNDEFDPTSESIRLDRVNFSSVPYPGDFGFVVGTKCGDGDPLDVLILVDEPTFPGCRVRVRPIGVLFLEDEGGDDEKLLAVPTGDPRFAEVYDLKDLPDHCLTEIEIFFSTYQMLEGKTASMGQWKGAKEACLALARHWCGEDPENTSTAARGRWRETLSATSR
jgi:inorganic pyrophosphatase